MQDKALFLVMMIETAALGGLLLLYPRIARRGILFGVYVGEEASGGERALAITRSWYRGVILSVLACLSAGVALAATPLQPFVAVAPVVLLLIAFLALYLYAHLRARELAPMGPPPASMAAIVAMPATSPIMPAVTLAAGVAFGLIAIAYTWVHYKELPARIPTHFGLSGLPDAWENTSFVTAMQLPLAVLVMGTVMGGTAWLTAHAKRALRSSDQGASLHAQMRFRAAVTRFVSSLGIVATGMMTFMSIQATRVSLGAAQALGPIALALGIAIALGAIGGTIYIALHYGQGGARIEQARVDTPLTGGLADNEKWVLGIFYVNRDDPSILVERRFGVGYTLNFGNLKAVAVLAGLFAILIAIAVISR
jgi:uncharacterized membrane protein